MAYFVKMRRRLVRFSSLNSIYQRLIVSFGVLLSSVGDGAEPVKIVKVISFDVPPLVSYKDGTPSGIMIDFLEDVVKEAHLKIEWVGPAPPARAPLELEKGEADILMATAKVAGRSSFGDYSKIPLSHITPVLLVSQMTPEKEIKSAKDLNGKVIGAPLGATLSPFLQEHEKEIAITRVGGNQVSERLINMLLEGRIWGAYSPAPWSLTLTAAQEKKLNRLKFIFMPDRNRSIEYYLLYSKKIDPNVRNKIEKTLAAKLKQFSLKKRLLKKCHEISGTECDRFSNALE